MSDFLKTIFGIACLYLVYTNFIGEESGCDKYASKFSCSYVEKKAAYDVYYWRNLSNGDDKDEKLIGSSVGLSRCRDIAISHANYIHERWNERAYICMLVKDGRNLEKHRLLY
jgi:hypothetical protein